MPESHINEAVKHNVRFSQIIAEKNHCIGAEDLKDRLFTEKETLERKGVDAAKADDVRMADVYTKNGAKVFDMDDATFAKPDLSSLSPAVLESYALSRRPDLSALFWRARAAHEACSESRAGRRRSVR